MRCWMVLTVLVLGLLAALFAAIRPAEPTRVTLLVFSGRPDPVWTLSPNQTGELEALLAGLPSRPVGVLPDNLGYRGFWVELPGQAGGAGQRSLRVFGSLIQVETGPQTAAWWDAARRVESWLLEQARAHTDPGLVEAIRAEVEDSSSRLALYLLNRPVAADQLGELELADLPLAAEPLLTAADMVLYRWQGHEIELTPDGYRALARLQFPVWGTPFVMTVDRRPICAGLFVPGYSSIAVHEWLVIDPLPATMDRPIRIELGYPASPELFTGVDRRSDPAIRAALIQAGVLYDVTK